MAEEVSPESKLYVKEEIEKSRKEIKEEVEKVNSKATKIFSTVAIVVGLITGLGVYGNAKFYIKNTIEDKLGRDTLAEIEENKIKAKNSYSKIVEYEAEAEKILSGRPIIGTIVPYGGEIIETTPGDPCQVQPGWFFCNGASLDREEYEELYKVIGEAFGASDLNTFNLPDLRGRFLRGVDYGQKRDPDAQSRTASNKGGNTGDKVGSVQNDAFARHHHPLERTVFKHWQSFQGTSGEDHTLESAPGDNRSREWIKRTTLSGGNETRPKNIYVNWIIKAQ